MSDRRPPIARIRLARSLPRLLAWPMLVVATGGAAIATWTVGSFGAGAAGIAFAVLGGLLVLVGLAAAALLLSIRVDVDESAIRLRWFRGERVYGLVPGPVTRVRLRGENASSLRPRIGFLGWGIGPARLRDEEPIHVVRLAGTRTAILVPTHRGRLAIAAANEEELLAALALAARARQRLEKRAAETASSEGSPAAADPTLAARHASPARPRGTIPIDQPGPRMLTGIERALLEQRLAAERATPTEVAPARMDAPGAETSEAARSADRPARGRRWSAARRRPRPAVAFAFLPLLGAGVVWAVGSVWGAYPEPTTDLGRLTSLALVLAGPATSVAAIMALAWWPRIVGVVVTGGLVASVLVGRALLG